MHKIKILDINLEAPNRKKKERIIKINDNLFEIGLRKGLIEKNEDEYYFIGDYEELIAFKNTRPKKEIEWLD